MITSPSMVSLITFLRARSIWKALQSTCTWYQRVVEHGAPPLPPQRARVPQAEASRRTGPIPLAEVVDIEGETKVALCVGRAGDGQGGEATPAVGAGAPARVHSGGL